MEPFFISNLTFDEHVKVLEKWYNLQSGLQNMMLLQQKELELIRRSNALAILEAQNGKQNYYSHNKQG